MKIVSRSKKQIKKDQTFKFRFTALRPIRDEEWALLDLTLRLIAEYGAIGGKTTLKRRDYGLIRIHEVNTASIKKRTIDTVQQYIKTWRHVDHNSFAWASLEQFWFVGSRYLDQRGFNQVLQNANCLAGKLGVSKKVFSFKEPQKARRTFGFVKPGTVDFTKMRHRLKQTWQDFQDTEFLEGPAILQTLLSAGMGGNP